MTPTLRTRDEQELLRRRMDGSAIFLAGPANVLLQLAWPEVGWGVAESTVTSGSVLHHPFKRFRTTVTYLGVAMLGDDELRAAYREAVDVSHRAVRSGPESPVRYNAFDPELQLWVASCLYFGMRDIMTRLHGPLSPAEEETLLAMGARFGTTLQVPEERWHRDFAAFEAYWAEGLARTRIDPPVRDYLMQVLEARILPFPLDLVGRVPLRWVNTGFLPVEIRDAMGLRWGARSERWHARLLRLIGGVSRPLPRFVRWFPINVLLVDVRRRVRRGTRLI
jgi:uncharacterized protein (DUF2236 family)